MSKELIDKDVAAYLLANPDFFVDRDRLLLKIQVPHKNKGTISLVEKQLDVLQTAHDEAEKVLMAAVQDFPTPLWSLPWRRWTPS